MAHSNWHGVGGNTQGSTGAANIGGYPGENSMFAGAVNPPSQFMDPPQLNQLSLAQQQLQDFSRVGNSHPGEGGYGSKDAAGNLLNGGKVGQTTGWGWGGEGGKAATLLSGIQTAGNLYYANKAAKLGAADLDFRKQSFDDQYASQRSLVNDQLFDRESRRGRESGMDTGASIKAADQYVKNRGVA
jgi:hypothetical protein